MYEIKYRDFQSNICQIAIQWYDKNKNILIWKETHVANNKEFTNYKLYIPLNKAINYPFLNIINTAGLDDIYDKFDKNILNK